MKTDNRRDCNIWQTKTEPGKGTAAKILLDKKLKVLLFKDNVRIKRTTLGFN